MADVARFFTVSGRVRSNAYVRLLPRLMLASDVTVRLAPSKVPLWIRYGPRSKLTMHALSGMNHAWAIAARARRAPRRIAREIRAVLRLPAKATRRP